MVNHLCSVAGCSKPAYKRGWCGMHYARWRRYSSLELPVRLDTAERRVWDKVSKDGPVHPIHGQCWVWTGCRNSFSGYGVLGVRNKSTFVHRYSYELHIGLIEDGNFVCHHCDNKICVNPDHLFTGDCQDNTDDKVAKDRQLKGEDISSAKLTEDQVRDVRRRYKLGGGKNSITAISRELGVSYSNVWSIIKRISWKHI